MKNFKFRDNANDGQWSSFLLPLCLLPWTIKSDFVPEKLIFGILIWITSIYMIVNNIHVGKISLADSHEMFYILFSIPTAIFISWITSVAAVQSYLICLAAVLSYNFFVSKLLINCPGSFTIGEAEIIIQGILIFIFYSLLSLSQMSTHPWDTKYNEAMDLLKLLLLGLLLLVCSLYAVPSLRKGLKFHSACFGFATGMALIWSFYYDKNPVLWLLEFCTCTHKRIYLLLLWLILTLASIFFVVWINQRPSYIASTIDRKYFHVIITAIYVSGVMYDIQLLCFASGIALGAFIVLEVYRILEVPVIGCMIGQAFQIFLDEKDSGFLILTHIYLLIGCSCSIWLSSYHVNKNSYHICLLSGIISVGFGDTCAAVGGKMFGKHQWKGSMKTLEGTAWAFISQLISSLVFLYIGHPYSLYNVSLLIISILLTSILEAKTTQVDNLILPLFMFMFLSWIE